MITIPTADLTGILGDVIPLALADDEFPLLNCVRLEWDGTALHAHATDRYRLGISTWMPGDIAPGVERQDDLFTDWGGYDDPWSMTVALADAKEIVKIFKLPPKEAVAVPLTIDYDAERWQARVARAKSTGYSGVSDLVQDQRHVFPDLRAMMADKRTEPCAEVAYSARYLADFAKVRPYGPLILTHTAGKRDGEPGMPLARVGEHFAGAIMPTRLGE